MKFDTTIIGGGLAGLVCGIRLSQQGQKCVIISSGQSALHFSSGSFDLLNTLPNGENIDSPLSAIDKLADIAPEHPYAKLGDEKFKTIVRQAESFFKEIGIDLQGSAEKNHFKISPIGTLKQTWLTAKGFAMSKTNKQLPWKKIAIFNIIGFLDFYPQFIADEFLKLGTEADLYMFTLPELDYLGRNPSEMRTTNIARILDKENNIKILVDIIKANVKDHDAVVLPDCIAIKDDQLLDRLTRSVGKPIVLIPAMPPSIVGIRIQEHLRDCFVKLGGVFMLGDSINKSEISDNIVTKLYSINHTDIAFRSQNVVLATGSYFSQGLIATSEDVLEPIFHLDVEKLKNRKDWYDPDVYKAQPYQKFGVKTDTSFRGIHKGKIIQNLYVAGAILEGFNPIKEGCGAGVSILTALSIAESIISKQK